MKSLFLRVSIALLAAVLLSGCDTSPSVRTTQPVGVALPPPDTTTASGAYQGATDYRVGAQDLLEITVFGVQELNRTVRINSNGQVSLPLVGGLQVGGHTVPEVEQMIATALEKTYLQHPQVTVFVKEYTSQRITMEGSVKNPGIYPIMGKTTLLQAVALAGGLDPLADMKGVVVFRQIQGKKMAAVFDMRLVQSGRTEDPQVYGDDVIVVEASGSKTALRRFIETIPAIALFMAL